MKLLKILSVTAVVMTLTATCVTQAALTGKPLDSRIKELETKGLKLSEVDTLLRTSKEGQEALTTAKQVITVRTNQNAGIVQNKEVTEARLAIAFYRNLSSKTAVDALLSANNEGSKMDLDVILVFAEKGLIVDTGTGNDNGVFVDSTIEGKPVRVNVLSYFEKTGAKAQTENWSQEAKNKREELSRFVLEAVTKEGTPSVIAAIRNACKRAGISFEEFIRLCLGK